MVALVVLVLAAPGVAHAQASRTIHVYGHAVDVYGGRTGKRAVVFHGLSGNRQAFATDQPTSDVITGLRRQHYQVIVPSLPFDTGATQAQQLRARFQADDTRGASYAIAFRRYVHAMLATLTRRYGHATTIAGGISWGGFHAMLATCSEPSISAYFAHSPVVDPRALVEFRGVALSGLTIQQHCANVLAGRDGFLSYGGADLRVGVAPMTRLLGTLRMHHACIASIEYTGLDHTTRPSDIAAILRWTSGV